MAVAQDALNLPADILKAFGLFQDSFLALPAEIRAVMVVCLTVVAIFGIVKILS
jgi:hypothetical protein